MKLYEIENYKEYVCKECLSQGTFYIYANSIDGALKKYESEGGHCVYCISDEILKKERDVKVIPAKKFINDGFTERFKCSCGNETSSVYIISNDTNNPMCEYCLAKLYTKNKNT